MKHLLVTIKNVTIKSSHSYFDFTNIQLKKYKITKKFSNPIQNRLDNFISLLWEIVEMPSDCIKIEAIFPFFHFLFYLFCVQLPFFLFLTKTFFSLFKQKKKKKWRWTTLPIVSSTTISNLIYFGSSRAFSWLIFFASRIF